MVKLTIGQRIRNRRKELNWSQNDLALKLNYKSRSSINKIESGLTQLSQSKIEEFAKVLQTTPAYLMGWSSEENEIKDNVFVYRYNVYASDTPFVVEEDSEAISFPKGLLPQSKKGYFYFIASDIHAKELDVQKGDILIFKKETNLKNGDIGCFRMNNTLICRYYSIHQQQVILSGKDQKIAPVLLSPSELSIQGKLVYIIKAV